MAVGEKRWSSQGKKVVRYSFEPVPSQDWEAKVRGDTAEIKKKPEPGKFPYISVRLECLNSAPEEGQKNRYIFQNFFLKLTPGADGVTAPERNGGLMEFARSMGEEINFKVIIQHDEEGQAHELFDPKEVLKWIKSKDGTIVKLHSKIRRSKDYPPQAEVDQFFAQDDGEEASGLEDAAPVEDEVEEEVYEETTEDEANEESMEASDTEDEDEEETPPARPARNGVHKPNKRVPPPPAKGKARPHARR